MTFPRSPLREKSGQRPTEPRPLRSLRNLAVLFVTRLDLEAMCRSGLVSELANKQLPHSPSRAFRESLTSAN